MPKRRTRLPACCVQVPIRRAFPDIVSLCWLCAIYVNSRTEIRFVLKKINMCKPSFGCVLSTLPAIPTRRISLSQYTAGWPRSWMIKIRRGLGSFRRVCRCAGGENMNAYLGLLRRWSYWCMARWGAILNSRFYFRSDVVFVSSISNWERDF